MHERKNNKISNMKRDDIFKEISKYKGKIRKIKNEIEIETIQFKKQDLEKKLKENIELVNAYTREFNQK